MTHRTPNQDVPTALPPGYRFNEFEIKEVIGGGGVGIVYRAWDHQLERIVAIKEFMPSSLSRRGDNNALVLRSQRCSKAFSAGLNNFIQQARLLAQFTHPNLLQVLHFWSENNTAYMATVFYSGMTLSRLKNHHPDQIDESWIRQMLPVLLDAMKTLHEGGYLHRDISLDNIQIQENGLPVLLDFGCARRTISNIADETEIMLRPGYTPIEQYSDDSENAQGPWTDIYALGAVLYTLIIGSPPPVSVARKTEDRYEPLSKLLPPGYSPSLLQAVDRALALQPQDRPQCVDEFAELLALPVKEEEPLAKAPEPPSLPVMPVNEVKRKPLSSVLKHLVFHRPAISAACVVAALVLGGVLIRSVMSTPQAALTSDTPSPPVASAALSDDEQEIALFYFELSKGSQLLINNKPYPRAPGPDGILTVRLKAGEYTFAVQQNGAAPARSVTVKHPGTWFITL
ncbi:serine/threonine protein kinase [Enterobacteriaceae bacterium 4M9]|nr:serine/threonine protein kinase [Enterobacteriaceae bacterium 4M9]